MCERFVTTANKQAVIIRAIIVVFMRVDPRAKAHKPGTIRHKLLI